MRETSASGVIASLRGSTYSLSKRLFRQAMGGRVKTVYASLLRSLWPCRMELLRILHGDSTLSRTAIFMTDSVVSISFSTAY